jgi:uncharacterized heparinase superfamily protein
VVKNLKALVGLAVFLGDARLEARALRSLTKQLTVQVLPDGGHFELSPSYHCQVLADLIDMRDLLSAAKRDVPPVLASSIERMRAWLGTMLLPDGEVPLFNDSESVGLELLTLLQPAPAPPDRLTFLDASGYVVLRPGPRLHLLMDVGPPCPKQLPAHAHADCLSLVLSVDGEQVLVDSGTSTYEDGPTRSYERSTAAHNTVTIDGENQTEVWGAFRAGRRAHPQVHRARDEGDALVISASHDGYRHLPGRPVHRRTVRAGERTVDIVDEILGAGTRDVVVHSHLAPGVACQLGSDGRLSAVPLLIQTTVEGRSVASTERMRPGSCAGQFGSPRPVSVFEVKATGPLPIRLSTTIRLIGGQ